MKAHRNKYNRTLVELEGVILLWGVLVQIAGVWFVTQSRGRSVKPQ